MYCLNWGREEQTEAKMLGYIAAVETVILERRKRKQKPRVLEFIHPAWPGLLYFVRYLLDFTYCSVRI